MENISADEYRQMADNHRDDRLKRLEEAGRRFVASNRWEYMITGSLASINPMGDEGWELVAVWPKRLPDHSREPNPGDPYLIFKRPKA